MTATSQLKEEHRAIKETLVQMEGMCQKLASGKKVDPRQLKELLEFLRIFVDRRHHAKEEGLLFPAMEKMGVPNEGGPIGMMLLEHDQGRGYIEGLAEAIGRYPKDQQSASAVVKNARGYIALLSDHIDKEDNILYMIADMHLSDAVQKSLVRGFKRIEKETTGGLKYRQLHKIPMD